jgi:hypothetical protein
MANDDKKKRLHEVAKRNFEYVPVDYEEFSKKASNPDFSRRLSQDLLELEKGGFIKKAPTYDVLISAFGATPAPTATTATPAAPESQSNVVPGGGQQAQARTFPKPSELQRGVPNQPLPNVGVPPVGDESGMPPSISGTPGQAPVGGQPGAQEFASQGGKGLGVGQFQITDTTGGKQAPPVSTQPQIIQPTVTATGTGGVPQEVNNMVAPPEQPSAPFLPQEAYDKPFSYTGKLIGTVLRDIPKFTFGEPLKGAAQISRFVWGNLGLPQPARIEEDWMYQAGEFINKVGDEVMTKGLNQDLPEGHGSRKGVYAFSEKEAQSALVPQIATALAQMFPMIATGAGSAIATKAPTLAQSAVRNLAGGVNYITPARFTIISGASKAFDKPAVITSLQMISQLGDDAGKAWDEANSTDREQYVNAQVLNKGAKRAEAEETYDLLKGKTRDEVVQSTFPLALGLAQMEKLPIDAMFKWVPENTFSRIMNMGLTAGVGLTTEMLTEGVQTGVENIGVNALYDKTRQTTEGIYDASRVGGATGFFFGLLIGGLKKRRVTLKQKVDSGQISPEEAISEAEEINKTEEFVNDKLNAFEATTAMNIPVVKENMESPEAQQFFDNNKPSETNPIVAMPTEVETVLDKISNDILISPEGLHEAYQWTNNAVKQTLENEALSPAEQGATLNILNGMLGDIDKANTEGQKFVEEVEVASVQDRVPAVRPEAELPQGQAPKAQASAPQAQGESIRQARRVRGGTNVLPSSGQTIVTPAPQGTQEAQPQTQITDESEAITEQQEEPVLDGVSDGGNQGQGGQTGSQLRSQESPQQAEGDAEAQVTTGTPDALADVEEDVGTTAEEAYRITRDALNSRKKISKIQKLTGENWIGTWGGLYQAWMTVELAAGSISYQYHDAKAKPESERTSEESKLIAAVEEVLTPKEYAVQKQSTAKVPVQPEAGVSTEVAQGSPEAKPESPAQQPTTPKAPEGATQGKAEVAPTEAPKATGTPGTQDARAQREAKRKAREEAQKATGTPEGDTEVDTKKQIENFGVAPDMVESVNSVISNIFDGLKNAGLTTAKTVGEWVGIGKGKEKPYSLKTKKVKYAEPVFIDGEGWAVRTLPHKYNPLGGTGIRTYPTKELAKVEADKQSEDIAKAIAVKDEAKKNLNITPEMKKQVDTESQPLFKDAEAQYRIESGKNIVEAIKDFNGTPEATVALTHEIMHPTVVSIIDGAKDGNEVGKKHTQTILSEYNKANPNKRVSTQELISDNDKFKAGETTDRYRDVQEFIAESWEKYNTKGGKGFSKAFQDALDQITKAFQSVYKSIPSKDITPELRVMFDELLGKQPTTPETPTGKPKAMTDYESRLEERRQAYKPGNTIIRDTNTREKVIDYTENPNDPNDWSVTTQTLDKDGKPVGEPRIHKTPPTKKEVQRSGFKTAEEIKKSSVLPNDNKAWADKFSSLVEDQKQSAKEQAKGIPKDSDTDGIVLRSGVNWKNIRKAFALPFKALDIGNRPISIAYVKFEDAVSKLVARGMRNSNKYYSGALNVLQGFAKNIAKTSAQVKQTRESMGAVADAVNTAIRFYNDAVSIVNGDATSLQRVHQVLDPEVYESAIQNGKAQKVELADLSPEEMNLYNALRTALDMIHEWHFANGFIKQKTYDKFKGKYIPRFWNDAGLTGQTETDLSEFARISKGINTEYIKKRKEIDDMGLDIIEDPVYATATRMAQMLRNQAFFDYANALSNTDKVYDGPDDMAPPSYIKLEGAKYGDLNGKWVSRDIAEDFDGYFLTNKFANMAYDLAKKWARIPLVRGIKESKTVYDITVFLGNMTNNITMAFVTGVDPVNLLSRVDEGIKAIKEKDADYRYLVQQGILGTDIVSNEIGMYTSGAPTQQLANQSIKDGLLSSASNVMDMAKKAYGASDDVAKIASFKSLVNDYGLSREEAATRVYDGLQNYGRVGRYFDVASKTPIVGNPYVKFAGDLGIMTKNALAKRPLNTIAFYMLLQGVAQLASRLSDEDEELKEAREARSFIPKIALPKTLNEMGIKDAPLTFMAGDTELNVARFISPYYIYDVGDHGYLGTLQEASKFAPIQITESESGLPVPKIGDPVLGPIISLFMDRDFRNKPILDPTKNKFYAGDLEGNPLAKTVNAIEYLSHAWIPYYPKISAIYSGLAGEEDYYGRKRDIKNALINVVIKTQKMTRTEVMEKYENDIEYKLNAIEGIEKDMATAYNKAIKGIDEISANKDLTEDQKAKRIEAIENNFYVREAKRQEEIAKIWEQALESDKYLEKAEGKKK